MTEVDQVTQRNASSAEELSSTAEEMASQAASLQQLRSFFRVDETAYQRKANRAASASQDTRQDDQPFLPRPVPSSTRQPANPRVNNAAADMGYEASEFASF